MTNRSLKCRELCTKMKKVDKVNGKIYTDNVKLCRTCDRFMYLDVFRCPCCNQKVTDKSRRYKRQIAQKPNV
jgi:hypothetical protein